MTDERADIEINEHRLDEEWVRQPALYRKWAVKAAAAQQAVDDAKNDFELIKADLDHEIRSDPALFDLSKVTETVVASTMVTQKSYQEAQSKLNEAKYEAAHVNAMVSALDHRKKALEKLVDLFLADYFSSPKPSKDARAHTEEIERKGVRGGGRQR